MTNEQPAPKPIFYAAQIWWFILGLFLFGALGFAMFFVGSSLTGAGGIVGVAVVMALLTGGAAIWAMRGKRIALGSGLLVGYAIAAVASGGQCTFLNTSANYGFLSGAVIYLYGFGLAMIIGMIASIVSAVTNRRKGPQ